MVLYAGTVGIGVSAPTMVLLVMLLLCGGIFVKQCPVLMLVLVATAELRS
jgi:hypothetical protein